jgi:flagellar hook-basal body complex protein FliE
MSNINSIDSLSNISSLVTNSANSLTKARANSNVDFSTTISNAIENLNSQQRTVEKEVAQAVVGESPDLHRTIAIMQTTEMNFQFALQVRNKLLNAYEEISRMQV